MKNDLKYLLIVIIACLFLCDCANIVAPTGGAKDVAPPEVKFSEPVNFSTGFRGNRINIRFDEFIQVQSINQNLIISPPMEEMPKVISRGKFMSIQLPKDLSDSTTYTLNFGSAIVDITERNPLLDYRFVFSTGDFIDSLEIRGQIRNAFDLKEITDAYIMLYNHYEDSTPLKEKPLYIARTGKTGEFSLGNLKSGSYKVFALKDVNNNYLFDQPNEHLAFLDTLITPQSVTIEKPDTVTPDSVVIRKIKINTPDNIELKMFQESRSDQFISEFKREKPDACMLVFNLKAEGPVEISPLNFEAEKWYVPEWNKGHDTLLCWITDSAVIYFESVRLAVRYNTNDTAEEKNTACDSLVFSYRVPKKPRQQEPDSILTFSTNIKGNGSIDLSGDLIVHLASPAAYTDTAKIRIYEIVDSVKTVITPVLFYDSLKIRDYHLNYQWKQDASYNLLISHAAYTGYSGMTNDSVSFLFTVEKEENYGTLIFSVKSQEKNLIIQLLTEKEKPVREFYTDGTEKITIPYLKPGKYVIKAIADRNNNKSWDTGNYLRRIQPEKVWYFRDEVNVKAAWDLELSWEISEEQQ
ncbi:MAG: Ig-like domain-containing protein [Bacteroidota bacterium]